MRVFALNGLLVAGSLAGCGSDAKETASPTADVAEGSDAAGDTSESGSGVADTGVADSGIADTETADTTPPPRCGRVTATGSDRATYDIILPLFERVATAEVTLDGSGVTILPAGEAVPYTGFFNPDSNCAQATVDGTPLALCFYDASGEDAQPVTLGAQFAAFLGAPGREASAALIGAQRRGIDRYCTVGGHWTVQLSQTGSEGTVASDAAPLVVASFDYLSLFDGGAPVEMLWNNPPQAEQNATFEAMADGSARLIHSSTVAKQVTLADGTVDEANLTFGWDLIADTGIGRLSGDLTVEIETAGGLSGRLTYLVSGGRL